MMKRVLASVLLFLCCAVTNSVAGTPFEGKVVYKIKTQDENMDMTIYAKENKSRMEFATHGQVMSMIMDSQAKKMYMVMDEQKMAMSISMDIADVATTESHKEHSNSNVMPKKTGKTKTILGYTCEQWEMRGDDGSVVELWSSKDMGSFPGFMNKGPMTGASGFDLSSIKEFSEMQSIFPMLIIVKDKSGKEALHMEATAIEKKSLSNSMFTVPTGYHVMEMPKGMDNMMMGGGDE